MPLMEMMLFEKKDLLDVTRKTLQRFGDANLESKSAREAVARKILEGVEAESESVEGENYFSKHEN